MLKEIEQLLKERGPIAAKDIAVHLETAEEAVQGMLELLESKGRIKRVVSDCTGDCGGCAGHGIGSVYWAAVE